jgi:hypothetical protein
VFLSFLWEESNFFYFFIFNIELATAESEKKKGWKLIGCVSDTFGSVC